MRRLAATLVLSALVGATAAPPARATPEPRPVPQDAGASEDGPPRAGDEPREGEPLGGEPLGGEPREGEPLGGEPREGEPREGEPLGGEPLGGEPLGEPAPAERGPPDDPDAPPPAGSGDASSPWYLERGTHRRTPRPEDDVPDVVFALEDLLRDGGIPGFYDGQFASTQDRFEDLVRVAQDEAMHHTIRIMAVMAAQEAADGAPLRRALEPLLVDPELEYQIERIRAQRDYGRGALPPDEVVRRELDVDLSRYARFALAKDGQPEAILDRIRVLEQYVLPKRVEVLDPLIETFGRFGGFDIYFYRTLWFDIAYHYQQFDDYASATEWFRQLTENLDGQDARMAHYNLACIAALTGEPEEAVTQLRGAMEDGFLNVSWMDEDGDLETLRGRPDYEALRREMLGLEPEPGGAAAPPSGADGSPEGEGGGA